MQEDSLFHEDIYDALRTCVLALGGPKKVGALLWPELPPDKAGNRLSDTLNHARRDVLNPEQVLWILSESRKIGCHAAMYFLTDNCDYKRPDPVEPKDEIAELQRDFIQAQKNLETMLKRMEHMNSLKAVG